MYALGRMYGGTPNIKQESHCLHHVDSNQFGIAQNLRGRGGGAPLIPKLGSRTNLSSLNNAMLRPVSEFQEQDFIDVLVPGTPLGIRGSPIISEPEDDGQSPFGFQAGRQWEAARRGLILVDVPKTFPPLVPYGSTSLPSKRNREEEEIVDQPPAKRPRLWWKRCELPLARRYAKRARLGYFVSNEIVRALPQKLDR